MSTETDALGAMTVGEFSERFKISRVTIYKEAKKRRLRLTKVGTRTIILLRDVLDWQASLKIMGGKHAA